MVQTRSAAAASGKKVDGVTFPPEFSASRSFDLWDFSTALSCLSPCLLTQRSTDGHLWYFATALPCLSPCLLTQRSTDGHLSAQYSRWRH